MSYAIRKDGKGWRAVESQAAITTDETWAAQPPETTAVQADAAAVAAALAKFRADRTVMLNTLTGIGLRAMVANDQVPNNLNVNVPVAAVVATFMQGLLDLPANPAVATAANPLMLNAAFKAYYGALVGAVPAATRNLFKGVLT